MFIIFENGKEHESTGGQPHQLFPKEYADRFRPMEYDESAADTPEALYQNWTFTYEDLGDKVKKTLVLQPKTAEQQRAERNMRLDITDHTQVDGFPDKEKFAVMRQQLRDLPTHSKWPGELRDEDWPTIN